jgi:hypothetical protein
MLSLHHVSYGGLSMKHGRGITASLLLTLLFASTAFAQFEIEVRSVETAAFPEITADVVVRQSGVIMRDVDSSDFVLMEDGFPQSPLHLSHPMPTQSFSLAILIGVGSTMSAGDIGFAAGVASRLVDRMDGIVDEGTVITYDDNIIIRQAMTHIKPLLDDALGNVSPTGGGNYIWEGGYKALMYLLGNSTHPSRTMIMFSNGKGDGGANDVQEVINLAKANNVKVHCFGVGAVGNDQQMRQLCQETGGTYYSSADLLVQELIDELNGTPEESQLTYTSDNLCRDGEDRTLFVQVKRNNDSTSTTFTTALAADPSGDVTVDLAPDTSTVVSGGTRDVALLFSPAVTNQRLHDTRIVLTFDTSLLRIEEIETTGHLADGMTAAFAMTANGADLTLTGTVKLDAAGALLQMKLRGGMVQSNTSVRMDVDEVTIDRGCLTVRPGGADITVRPRTASLSTSAQPVVFNWDASGKRYSPDPAEIIVEVTNNGDLPLSNIMAELAESDDIRIAYGGEHRTMVLPSSLEPGEQGTATWYVQAHPQPSEKTAQVNAHVTSDEGATAQQRLFLNIKPATSAVALRCDIDEISVAGGQYAPDPAELRATITSAGSGEGPAGEVNVVLPTEITLDGGTLTQSFDAMSSGSEVTLTWALRYPQPLVETSYEILVVREAAGFDNDTCFVTMTIPVLTAAQLAVTCAATPAVVDSTVSEITYSTTVRNNGNADADNVSASLILPTGLSFAEGESAAKAVADPLFPGAEETVRWILVPVGGQRCEDISLNPGVLVSYAAGAEQCATSLTLEATGNLLPEILSVEPLVLDTLPTNSVVDFSIQAIDAEGGALTWSWFIDGNETGENAAEYSHTFSTEGDYLVRVDVYDRCTAAMGTPVSHTWNVYVYNVTSILPGIDAKDFAILGNYPNPFNPATVVEYRLPEGRHEIRLEVLDQAGRHVRTLQAGTQQGGIHRVLFDAEGLPSGSYLLHLHAGSNLRVHRMLLVK